MPHLRLVFRDVYRELDELPGRSAGPGVFPATEPSWRLTHDRKELFLQAGRTIVDLARRYYEQDDTTVLPRSIATFEAFENAMTLDIAMGGSTNTVLHLLAAAQEGAGALYDGRYRPAFAPRPEPLQGGALRACRASGRCASRRRNLRHPRRTGSRGTASSLGAHGSRTDAR